MAGQYRRGESPLSDWYRCGRRVQRGERAVAIPVAASREGGYLPPVSCVGAAAGRRCHRCFPQPLHSARCGIGDIDDQVQKCLACLDHAVMDKADSDFLSKDFQKIMTDFTAKATEAHAVGTKVWRSPKSARLT